LIFNNKTIMLKLMKRLNQKGFSPLHIVLLVVVIAIIGFAGWYVWDANQKTSDTEEVTPTPTPTLSVSITPTPTTSQYLVIDEWGVRGSRTVGITLMYGIKEDNSNQLYFSSSELIDQVSPYCGFKSEGIAGPVYSNDAPTVGMGMWAGLYRTTDGNEHIGAPAGPTAQDEGKLINGYWYVYGSPQSTCLPENFTTGEALITQTSDAARAFYDTLETN
jgi:hypothetical protein